MIDDQAFKETSTGKKEVGEEMTEFGQEATIELFKPRFEAYTI